MTKGARPVIVARHGFSDRGNQNNADRAFLGNRRYDRGERLGDIVLAADAKQGQGAVLVFGDTSPFQNLPIPFHWRFVLDTFSYVSGHFGYAYGAW